MDCVSSECFHDGTIEWSAYRDAAQELGCWTPSTDKRVLLPDCREELTGVARVTQLFVYGYVVRCRSRVVDQKVTFAA